MPPNYRRGEVTWTAYQLTNSLQACRSSWYASMKQQSRMEASSVPVQQQEGGTDCGLFSIAYPYHASVGDCLEEMVFDQGMMGRHLLHCFESQKLTAFLQLSAPARHGKTWHNLFLSIVLAGCQSVIHTCAFRAMQVLVSL